MADNARNYRSSDLGLTVVLAGCFALAAFLVIAPVILWNTSYTYLEPPLPPNKQSGESAIFVVMLLLVAPASIFLAWRTVARIRSGPAAPGLEGLIAALVIPLGLGLFAVSRSGSLSWGRGVEPVFFLGLAWLVFAIAFLAAASRKSDWRFMQAFESAARPLGFAALIAAGAAILSLVNFDHIDGPALLAGLLLAAGLTWVYARCRLTALPRGWGIAFDVVFVLLLVAAVPNLGANDPGADAFRSAYVAQVIQFHQGLFLGAVNQILGGSTLLVDTVSQYGVGSIYLLAAFFKIAPIGFAGLAFFEGLLTGLVFAIAYGVLRMAGLTRTLAAAAMLLAVVILAWGTSYPVGALLQHGSLRFGLPMLLIAPVVAGARWPRLRPFMLGLALMVTGVSSIWALEGFIYVTAAAVGLAVIQATWMEKQDRLRFLLVAAGSVLASWVVAHLLFALITLAASGSWPDWGLYMTYLREFLSGDVGEITYDVRPWTPAFGMFGIYLFSAFGLVAMTLGRRETTRSHQAAFLALGGLTAYGLALFSYYDNRSLEHVLQYIGLPALLLTSIWIGLVLDRTSGFPQRVKVAAVAASLAVAALTVANVWPSAPERGQNSLLAYALPGGKSLGDALDRTWDPPPIRTDADDGQALIEEYFPGQRQVPVLTIADLDLEMLMRSGRSNQLGIADANEASWVPAPHVPAVRERARSLEAGDRIVVDTNLLMAYDQIKDDPGLGLTDTESVASAAVIQDIQVMALAWIVENYTLTEVASIPEGISVMELSERPSS